LGLFSWNVVEGGPENGKDVYGGKNKNARQVFLATTKI
jgi:hypothetical protein